MICGIPQATSKKTVLLLKEEQLEGMFSDVILTSDHCLVRITSVSGPCSLFTPRFILLSCHLEHACVSWATVHRKGHKRDIRQPFWGALIDRSLSVTAYVLADVCGLPSPFQLPVFSTVPQRKKSSLPPTFYIKSSIFSLQNIQGFTYGPQLLLTILLCMLIDIMLGYLWYLLKEKWN